MSDQLSGASKADLRAAALARRDALSDKQRAKSAQALAKRGLPFEITHGMVVSGYAPMNMLTGSPSRSV